MKSYKDVESTIIPEIEIFETQVRVPSNVREVLRKNEADKSDAMIYVYDENIYTLQEYLKILNDRANQTEIAVMSLII